MFINYITCFYINLRSYINNKLSAGFESIYLSICLLQLSEYNQLEQQLRKSLTDLEKREKQLAANEQEVSGICVGGGCNK